MEKSKSITPVAYIYNGFSEKFGIPRQSGRVEETVSEIVFEKEFRASDAIRGITDFSHLWLLFGFSEAKYDGSLTVRPPRLGGNTRVGVFASRSPFRPNGLGLSRVKLLRVENREGLGGVLIVGGADILSGSPVYDIKPYLPFADSVPDASAGYSSSGVSHRLAVSDPYNMLGILPKETREIVTGCISDDPRPSYQNDKDRVYAMVYGGYEIKFTVFDEKAVIRSVGPKQ